MKKRTSALSTVIILAIAIASYSFTANNKPSQNAESPLKVHFLDVGQGDSILVQSGNASMLIDAGTTESADIITDQLKLNNISKIDVFIGTHPHEDHIGSMDTIIDTFDIGKVYMPKVNATTKSFTDVINSIKNKGLSVTAPVPGSSFKLGDAVCTILAPNDDKYDSLNNYSIVLKLVFGETSFLFTGDAEEISEKEIISKGYDLTADVLKVGHHGSSSSTSSEFLEKTDPEYAVIMCAKNNDYGHPHKETINSLSENGIKILRTDKDGTINFSSDGKTLSFNTQSGS